MQLAKAAKRKPRELAQAIVAALPASDLVAKVEIAGPGFINFFVSPAGYHQELLRVLDEGAAYGRSRMGAGQRVIVEFVSANPTGPLHVGHGRHAAFGATLANLLDAAGYSVHREYYINDAGRQMEILAASVWLRYLECFGEQFPFPSNGYRGDYLHPIADKLVERRRSHAGSPRGRDLPRPAARRAGRRQGHLHRRRHRAREGAARRGRLPPGVQARARRHPRRHPPGPRGVRGALRRVVLRAQPRHQRRDRPRARAAAQERRRLREGRRAVVPRHRFRRREGSRRRARERAQDLLRVRHRLPPAEARARLRQARRRARRRPPRLHRARPGRASSRWASPATASRCASCSS